MNKIWLITEREYLTRVRKKSFIVMSILGPILMAVLMIVPAWLSVIGDKSEKSIAVIDVSKEFQSVLRDNAFFKFHYLENQALADVKQNFSKSGYYAVLHIPVNPAAEKVQLYSDKQPNMEVKMYISNALEKELERRNLKAKGIDEEVIKNAKVNLSLETFKWTEDGKEEKSSTYLTMGIGFVAAILIYMFVFMYGVMVMRGVIEEKTNRIVEVIISSVKPLELMLGKIIGIAFVALTQFLLWIILTFGIVTVVQGTMLLKSSQIVENQLQNPLNVSQNPQKTEILTEVLTSLNNVNFTLIIGVFLFYFLVGYLLYAALFAAVGSAVDNETDTQQFMLPITIPLILAFVLAQVTVQYPHEKIAFWLSMIPFTSPVTMMIRLPFGVPAWQLILSMTLLTATFLGIVWFAAKIYRTGILMYGKKVNYKELWKWLRY